MPVHRCIVVGLAAACIATTAARAQADASTASAAHYRVTVSMHDPAMAALLEKNLELTRRRDDADIDLDALQILVDRSVRQARSLLATQGYFAPQVNVDLDASVSPPHVTLTVDEGTPVRVRRIDFALVGAGKDAAERFLDDHDIDGQWRLSVGDRFRQDAWDATKTAWLAALRAQLFPQARIARSQATIDPEHAAADLALEIEPGDPRYFGDVSVEGLQRYAPSTVLNLNDLVRPGDAYRQSALIDLQNKIQAQPTFKDAIVTADPERADASGRVPVTVTVVEYPRKVARFGAGVSTNTGVRGTLGYDDYAAFGSTVRWLNQIELTRREQHADTTFALPTDRDRWDDSLRLQGGRSDIEHLVTRTYQIDAKRARDERNYQRAFGVKYLYSDEHTTTTPPTTTLARALVPYWSWTRRALDDLQAPRRGDVLAFQVSGAVKAVLSDATFARVAAKWLHVIPLGERDAIALRVEGGAVLASSREGIPQDQLFRAGGDASIRGYAYQSIGVVENGAIVGGRYLVLGGVDLTHWIDAHWGVGVFYDTGDAFDHRDDFKLYNGIGAGPRWRSPVGPINVDLAYGQDTHKVRLHVSLGIVF